MESISSTPVKITSKRIQELDALRGIASLSVVLFHYTYSYDNGQHLLSDDKFYFRFGYLGVQLFFMISGFVILMTLDNTPDYKQFIISRFSRLYPVYWFCIGLTVAVSYLSAAPLRQGGYSVKQILVNLTMLQRFAKIEDIDGAYWTLAIELVFYFWAALLVYMAPRRILPYACYVWLFLSILSLLNVLPFRNYLNQLFILPHAGFFVAGLCYYLIRQEGSSTILWGLLLTSLVVNGLSFMHIDFIAMHLTVFVVYYLTFYLLIRDKLSILRTRWLLFLGAISYPLYLSHEVIGMTIIYWLRRIYDHEWFYVGIPLLIIMGVAYLIHRYVERPAMRYIRQRFMTQNRVASQLS